MINSAECWEAIKRHPLLRYSANVVKFSDSLGLFISYIIHVCENRVPLKVARGLAGCCIFFFFFSFFSFISHEQTQSNRVSFSVFDLF